MTTDEINRYIHVEIMGKREKKPDSCPICNVVHDDARQRFENAGGNYPDYCSDDSPRSLLNEVVAKVIDVVPPTMLMCRVSDILEPKFDYMWPEYQLTMSAEQIARTCVKSHQAK